MTKILADALAPVFAGLLLGYCAGLWRKMDNENVPAEQMRYVILISAMPCGFFGVVFGKGFGSNPKLVSSGLMVSYLLGIGTLAAWIVIVNHLA